MNICDVCSFESSDNYLMNKHISQNHVMPQLFPQAVKIDNLTVSDMTENKLNLSKARKQERREEKRAYKKVKIKHKANVNSFQRQIVKFSCNICEFKHFKEENVKCHIEAEHVNSEKVRTLRIGCELCESDSDHQECPLPKSNKHKCNECDYSSNYKTVLRKHTDNVHKKIVRFSCNLCDYKHFYKHTLKYHQEHQHVTSSKFKRILKIGCLKCDEGEDHINCFIPQKSPKEKKCLPKMKRNSISKSYTCDYDGCNFSSNFSYMIQYHLDYYHEKIARYACNNCDYKYFFKHIVQNHQQKKHPNSENNKILTIGCELCNAGQDHDKCFKKQERRQRPKVKKQVKSEKNSCQICDFTFDALTKADHYKKNHPESKIYNCNQCLYGSNYSQNLKTHTETLHLKKQYSCDNCDYVTKWKTQYHSHMRDKHAVYKKSTRNSKKELKDSNFKCSFCEYSSSYKWNLNEHVNRVHGGFKFKCSKCDFVTKSKQYLKTHESIQHNGKSFDCDECTYQATSKSNLKLHQNIKHLNKCYKCDNCKFKCKSKQYLKQHNSRGCFKL